MTGGVPILVPSWLTALVLGALVTSLAACVSAPPRENPFGTTPPEFTVTESPAEPPVEEPPPAPMPVAPPAVPVPERDPSVIVIDEPEAPTTSDLVSASRSAREQRERSPATTKITNKNLKDFAAGGSVTTADPKTPSSAELDAASAESSREEQKWRERVLDLRLRARRSRDEIQRLETEVAGLRRSFYVEDDAYARDSRIKPAWDRSLDNLNFARRDAEALQLELSRVLDEARQAGALPGWLREGLELESDLTPPADSGHQAIEPPVAGEPIEPIPPP